MKLLLLPRLSPTPTIMGFTGHTDESYVSAGAIGVDSLPACMSRMQLAEKSFCDCPRF